MLYQHSKHLTPFKQKLPQIKLTNLDRENIYLIQTPQAFDYKKLYAVQNNKGAEVKDDAKFIYKNLSKKIKIIKGEIHNNKITINSDIKD